MGCADIGRLRLLVLVRIVKKGIYPQEIIEKCLHQNHWCFPQLWKTRRQKKPEKGGKSRTKRKSSRGRCADMRTESQKSAKKNVALNKIYALIGLSVICSIQVWI
jgi:hypothetical protein